MAKASAIRTFQFLGLQYLQLALNLVQFIVLVPLYLHFIPTSLYGGWLATGNIIALIGSFDFGVFSVLQQRVANYDSANQERKLNGIIAAGVTFAGAIAIVIYLVGFILAEPLLRLITANDPANYSILYKCILISLIGVSLSMVGACFASVFYGLQRLRYGGMINIASSLFGIISTIVLLYLEKGVLALAYGFAARSLFSAVFNFFPVSLLIIKSIRVSVGEPQLREAIRELLGLGSYTAGAKILQIFSQNAEALVMSWLLGNESAAIYSVNQRPQMVGVLITQRIGFSFKPLLSSISATPETRDKLSRSISLLLFYIVWLSIGLSGSLLACHHVFLLAWLGPGFYAGPLFTVATAISALLIPVFYLLNDMVFAVGWMRFSSTSMIVYSLSLLILYPILTAALGVIGPAFAPAVPAFLVIVFYLFRLGREGLLDEEVCLSSGRMLILWIICGSLGFVIGRCSFFQSHIVSFFVSAVLYLILFAVASMLLLRRARMDLLNIWKKIARSSSIVKAVV